jgi:ATP-dependent Clp protease ATP-binding subunit ClpA
MNHPFTDRARKVMLLANQEAQRLNHYWIGTEHLLLGIVKDGFAKGGSGVAGHILKSLHIDLAKIRREVEKIVLPGQEVMPGANPQQTPRAKNVIEYSVDEARKLNHNFVGTEHLLLGLLREQEGVAAQVLFNLGLRIEDVRAEIIGLDGMPSQSDKKNESDFWNDPYTELQDLQTSVIEELKALDAGIHQLNQEKEEAVAGQDFEKAAHLRDQAENLKKKWFGTICECGKNPDFFVCPPGRFRWRDQ